MRYVMFLAFACSSSKHAEEPKPKPTTVAATDDCRPAYAEYEKQWRTARSEELAEFDFDKASIEEILVIEVALLPTKSDVGKLRNQYAAIAVFLPDAPWPRALDAAAAAITVCGEEAPRP
jgi:hypothetical protein